MDGLGIGDCIEGGDSLAGFPNLDGYDGLTTIDKEEWRFPNGRVGSRSIHP